MLVAQKCTHSFFVERFCKLIWKTNPVFLNNKVNAMLSISNTGSIKNSFWQTQWPETINNSLEHRCSQSLKDPCILGNHTAHHVFSTAPFHICFHSLHAVKIASILKQPPSYFFSYSFFSAEKCKLAVLVECLVMLVAHKSASRQCTNKIIKSSKWPTMGFTTNITVSNRNRP